MGKLTKRTNWGGTEEACTAKRIRGCFPDLKGWGWEIWKEDMNWFNWWVEILFCMEDRASSTAGAIFEVCQPVSADMFIFCAQ